MTAERARGDILRLVHRGLGVRDFSLAAARSLHRAVPFDGVYTTKLLPGFELIVNPKR